MESVGRSMGTRKAGMKRELPTRGKGTEGEAASPTPMNVHRLHRTPMQEHAHHPSGSQSTRRAAQQRKRANSLFFLTRVSDSCNKNAT